MYPVSKDYQNAIAEDGREELAKVEIDLMDGTHLSLNNHDIMQSGLEVQDATSGDGSFQVGAAIINQLTLTLNNFENKFSSYNFDGAVIRPYVGLVVKKDWHGDTVEYVPMGIYTVDAPIASGSVITITALDNMAKLDTPYSKSSLIFPTTLKRIAEDACSTSGVIFVGADFPNSDYVVSKRPEDKKITCREIISYAAQLAGCFARCSRSGEVEIKWYQEPTNIYDVGFKSTSVTTGIFETEITGVDITGNDEKKTVYKSGIEDYAINISDNPLVQDNVQQLADSLWKKFTGFKFRSYSSTSVSNPTVEAGDIVNLTDGKGKVYRTFVSNLDYKIGESEQYSASAESQTEKHQERNTVSAQVLQKAHEEAEKQISAYDVSVKQLSLLMINAMGFYETVEKRPDGSEIDYMHDRPNLADSTTVWKRTVDGIAVSTDGGHTFTAGITADGNAVVKVLTAIGINADWIIAGILKSRNGSWELNLDDGTVTGITTFEDLKTAGKTEINGANIVTGKITSHNGKVYFDLDGDQAAVSKLISTDDSGIFAQFGYDSNTQTYGLHLSQKGSQYCNISNFNPYGSSSESASITSRDAVYLQSGTVSAPTANLYLGGDTTFISHHGSAVNVNSKMEIKGNIGIILRCKTGDVETDISSEGIYFYAGGSEIGHIDGNGWNGKVNGK